MQIDTEAFLAEYKELSILYNKIKDVVILAENIDGNAMIAPINELRNAFDHIMRIAHHPQKMSDEFHEAREHLYRAGYDAYELIALNVFEETSKNYDGFSREAISNIFPKYFNEIRPTLLTIKQDIADARSKKELDPETGLKSFDQYVIRTNELLEIQKEIDRYIPDIVKEQKNLKKSANKAFIKDKGTNILVAIFAGIIMFFITKYALNKGDINPIPKVPTKSDTSAIKAIQHS